MYGLIQDHRAGARIEHDFRGQFTRRESDVFHLRQEGDAAVLVLRRAHLDHAPIERIRGVVAEVAVDRLHHPAHRGEVGLVQFECDVVGIPHGGGLHRALDRGAGGDASGGKVVDLHTAAARRRAHAREQDIALGDGVDIAVRALERGHDQRAAAQALGVGQRGDCDVDGLSWLREGRQHRRHHHRRDIFQLQPAHSRQVDAERGEHG